MNEILNYDELIALALEHYNEGGDGVYECWDKRCFEEHVEQFGDMTITKALDMFKLYKSMENEYY